MAERLGNQENPEIIQRIAGELIGRAIGAGRVAKEKTVARSNFQRIIDIALEDINLAISQPARSILKTQHPNLTQSDFETLKRALDSKAGEAIIEFIGE